MICIDCRSEYTIKATLLKTENGTVVLNAYSVITWKTSKKKEEEVIFFNQSICSFYKSQVQRMLNGTEIPSSFMHLFSDDPSLV